MAKLSFTFETTTEEKNEMKAVLNFMLAINGIEQLQEPIVAQPEVTKPEVKKPEVKKEEPKQDFSFTVSEPKEEPKIEQKEQTEVIVPEVKEEPKETIENTQKEKTAEQIKEEKNAKRRERYAEAQKKKEEESKQAEASNAKANTEAMEHKIEVTTEHAPEVSKVVAEDNAQPDDAEALRLAKIAMQDKVRLKMQEHAENHRESIRKFLVDNGIKGLVSMTMDQLEITYEYLLGLS